MNVIHSIEDNNSQIIHVSVNSNDRGATGEKGDSIVNVKITDTNRLETTLSNGQTIDGGAVPAIKTRRVFVAEMDGIKRTYILPLNIESSQVSYILMNGVAYSDGYILQSGEITLNYDDLPAGRLEVVLNDNSGHVSDINVSINGKTGDIHLKTINGSQLDGDGDIEVTALDAFNNEVRAREGADNNLRNSLSGHETRISNNESTISSHGNNLSSLNANISSINNQMTVLTGDVHEVTDNYVPKTRRINDKFLSHDIRLTADDVEALPITAGITHPVRGELVVNGHITAESATQDNHVVTKAQLDAKVAEVVNSAPETLDTLEELSKALGDDPNFATTIANKIGTVDKKIDTEINKLTNKVEVNTENLKNTTQEANANSTNISLLNSTVATNKLSSDTQFSNVAKEQDEQNSLISDILNAFSKESEKGTNLKLNSSSTKVLGMTIYGNTEQVKTSGYNIFRFGDMNNTLSQGIKSKTDENGYITSTGTATTDWASVTAFDSNSVLTPGTYTLSIEPSAPIRTSINGELVSNNSYKWLGAVDPGQSKVTFTVTEPIKQVRLSIRTVPNQALNIKFRPMLEAGIEAHSYEPYTGGAVNLYDCTNSLPVTVDGLTLKQEDGMIRCTGTTKKDNIRFQEKLITDLLENNTAYSVYADTPTSNLRLTVRLKRKDNNNYEYYNTIDNQVSVFTWNTAVYSEAYIYLVTGEKSFWNGSNSVLSRFGLFEGGSFDGNNYTHVGMNAPTFGEIKGVNNINIFSQGKNLFDTRFGERVVNGVNIKTYSDGSFELNGTPTTGFSLMNVFNSKSYIPSEKYKLKIEHLGGSVEKVWSGAYFIYTIPIQRNTSKQPYQAVLKPEHLNNSSNEFAIIVNDILEEYYVSFVWIPYHIETSEAFWNYKNLRLRITLVKDGENTDFTEFISSSLSSNLPALYKVGNYQDYIIMRDDKWYLVKNTATKILNGSEGWIKTAELENIFICQNIINATKNYDDAYFSHFNNIKRYPNTDRTGAIRGDNGTNVAFCMNNIPNITGFKNWLSQNNVTVLYPIAQPITTEVTDSTTLAELNKLKQLRTYDGTTNILVTATGATPEIRIKYLPNLKGVGG
nr:MAG TPA: hypothetical protein [Caudoviricetes sp.]